MNQKNTILGRNKTYINYKKNINIIVVYRIVGNAKVDENEKN